LSIAAVVALGVSTAAGAVSAQEAHQGNANDQNQGSPNTNPNQRSQDQTMPGQGSQNQATPSQGGETSSPTAVRGTMATATATIRAIDKAGGKLTLSDAQGRAFDLKAGPDVNLDQLHVGDRVLATYYAEVAVALSKHPQGAPKLTETTQQRAGLTARQATLTARVVSVDTKKNNVVVQGPQGKKHTLTVDDPDLQAQLAQVKPGDNVDITYTEALAVGVQKVAKK
jgi:hypothetical protein